jgi:hypothetical protein
MRPLCLVAAMVLAINGNAMAQQMRLGPFSGGPAAMVESRAATPPPPLRAAVGRPAARPPEELHDDPTRVTSQLFARLPLARIEHVLRTNGPLRVVEAAIGASVLGYQLREPQSALPLAQIAVHAIRFSGAEWLDRRQFEISPEVRRGGFAITFKKRQ